MVPGFHRRVVVCCFYRVIFLALSKMGQAYLCTGQEGKHGPRYLELKKRAIAVA